MSIAEFQASYFQFLDELQESGDTNMYGASTYLQDKFWIEKSEAKDVLKLWMESKEVKL